jgi:hypothetical protein
MGDLVKLTDPAQIDSLPVEERGIVITQALEESKSWLAVATTATDPTPITEFRAWAATVAEMTKQKRLAQEIQFDALEMVRRAERGIGVAVRNGQEAGTIRGRGESGGPKRDYVQVRNGKEVQHKVHAAKLIPDGRVSPTKFFDGGQTITDIYTMADSVTDEQFDAALSAAREEKNLSRNNVVRKVRVIASSTEERLDKIRRMAEENYTSRQIADSFGMRVDSLADLLLKHDIAVPADAVVNRRARRIDPTHVIAQTISTLEGLVLGLQLLEPEDYDRLDPAQVNEWSKHLSTSMQALNQLKKELNRVRS